MHWDLVQALLYMQEILKALIYVFFSSYGFSKSLQGMKLGAVFKLYGINLHQGCCPPLLNIMGANLMQRGKLNHAGLISANGILFLSQLYHHWW